MAFDLSNYVPVADRLDKFRADHPTWGLTSSLLFHDEKRVVVRASISDESGREVAAGHAEEVRGQGNVNRTSALENAETSAWGRALAALGYDVKGGIASQEEMKRAQSHSSPPKSARKVDTETGEIQEPPNVSAAIDKLDQEGRKELLAKMEKANFPSVDQLPPAAAKQVVKWVDDLLEEQKKREPF
jgi:hypothetical protein